MDVFLALNAYFWGGFLVGWFIAKSNCPRNNASPSGSPSESD